jgi:D-aminoacyl-tRNA deacylase
MKVVLQRVAKASVRVDGGTVGDIGAGLLLLVAIAPDDDANVLVWMARKCAELRIFADDEGLMNRSLLETGGEILLISQFTLYGDTRKGRRPSFLGSAEPELAKQRYEEFGALLADMDIHVEWGIFGAHMEVESVNDGPVTLLLER